MPKSYIQVQYLKFLLFSFCLPFLASSINAQQAKVLSLDDAVNMALSNHPSAKIAELELESAKVKKDNSLHLEPAKITWQYGQGNSPVKDNYFSVSQNFGSPLTHIRQNQLGKNEFELAETDRKISQKQLIASVKKAYFQWIYQYAFIDLLEQESNFYETLLDDSTVVADTSTQALLDKLSAENHYAEAYRNLLTAQEQLKIETNRLNRVIYSEGPYEPVSKELDMYSISFPEKTDDKFYPYTFKDYLQKKVIQKNIETDLEKSRFFPEISAGYFSQKLTPIYNVRGFEIGLSVPLWFTGPASKVKEARINRDIALTESTRQTYELEQTIDDLKIQLDQEFINIMYSRENGLKQADLMLGLASSGFRKKQISTETYFRSIAEAMHLKQQYLKSILNYNLKAVELEYYLN